MPVRTDLSAIHDPDRPLLLSKDDLAESGYALSDVALAAGIGFWELSHETGHLQLTGNIRRQLGASSGVLGQSRASA